MIIGLPSETTKSVVYQDYIAMIDSIQDAAQVFIRSATQSASLNFCKLANY